jgi:uncharacterized protein (TIGR02444 family)
MPNKPQNFWKFSLELYDREGVAAACLALQEEYQLDVNLLLFCYWYGSNFGVIETELLRQVIDFSAEWRRHVVQPLRDARNWMKLNGDNNEQFQLVRAGIKTEELAAEKYQQERLASIASTFSSTGQRKSKHMDIEKGIEKNIDRLLEALGITRNKQLEDRIEAISSALDKQAIANR